MEESAMGNKRYRNEGFENLAEIFGTGFVNAAFWNIPLCFDMVHFSEEGHRTFAKKLGEYLRESF